MATTAMTYVQLLKEVAEKKLTIVYWILHDRDKGEGFVEVRLLNGLLDQFTITGIPKGFAV